MNWELHVAGHTFWTVQRARHPLLSVTLVDLHPGTFAWSLLVVVHAAAPLQNDEVHTILTLSYTPLLPGGMRCAHMVFGGFHCENRSPASRAAFYHIGRLGLATDSEAQVVGAGETGYVQWMSPYFRDMECRVRVDRAQEVRAGDVVCALVLGTFGQPCFVHAARKGALVQAFQGVPDVLIGYPVARASHLFRHAGMAENAEDPTDAPSCSLDAPQNAPATCDFGGVFMYHVLPHSGEDWFKVVLCAFGDSGASAAARSDHVCLLCPGRTDPAPFAAAVPTDRARPQPPASAVPEWKASMWFDPPNDASATRSFTLYPWLERRTVAPQVNRIDPDEGSVVRLGADQFAVAVVRARYGDMWCSLQIHGGLRAATHVYPYAFDHRGRSRTRALHAVHPALRASDHLGSRELEDAWAGRRRVFRPCVAGFVLSYPSYTNDGALTDVRAVAHLDTSVAGLFLHTRPCVSSASLATSYSEVAQFCVMSAPPQPPPASTTQRFKVFTSEGFRDISPALLPNQSGFAHSPTERCHAGETQRDPLCPCPASMQKYSAETYSVCCPPGTADAAGVCKPAASGSSPGVGVWVVVGAVAALLVVVLAAVALRRWYVSSRARVAPLEKYELSVTDSVGSASSRGITSSADDSASVQSESSSVAA